MPGDDRVAPATAHLAGWLLVGVVNALVVAVLWRGGDPLAHAIDLGQHTLLGAASGAAALGARRAPSWVAALGLAAASGVVAWLAVPDDLVGAAVRAAGEEGLRGGNKVTTRVVLWTAAVALVPVAAHLAARWLAARGARAPLLIAALAVAAVNARVLPHGYQGLHLVAAWAAALVAAAALVGAAHPRVLVRRPVVALAIAAALGAASVAMPPPNRVRIALWRHPGSVLAPFAMRLHPFRDAAGRPVEGEDAAWYALRAGAPPVPPTPGAQLGPDAIVVLFAVDSMRADVLDDPRARGRLPNLERLRGESVRFTRARSTGAATVPAVTTVFAGTHYSQQYWSKAAKRAAQYWPREETGVRFPSLLAAAGVATYTATPYWWMTDKAGVLGGFTETELVKRDDGSPRPARAHELGRPTVARIARHEGGRLFLYIHCIDAHAPYDAGEEDASTFDRYVAELAAVDRVVGEVRAAIEAVGLWERSVLVVFADHGEAFGEHGTWQHAVSVYDELLHVPLLVRAPGATPRDVDEPVSTIDLAPTLLDLHGVATPGHYMGQSLVPLLRGADARLDRPIVAEARRKQALVTRAGVKAIRDLRAGTLEVYDLSRDPGELENLAAEPAGADALNRLRRFFDVHTLRRGDYEPPYRP